MLIQKPVAEALAMLHGGEVTSILLAKCPSENAFLLPALAPAPGVTPPLPLKAELTLIYFESD